MLQKSSVPGPSAFAETLSATLPPRDSKFSSARERLGEAVRAWNPGHKMHKSGELRYSVGIIANDTISCTWMLLRAVVVQSLSHVRSSMRPWTAAHQAPLSSTGVCSHSCPLSRWCCLSISPSAIPSPSAFSLSQHQGLFQWVGSSHQVATVLELQLQHQSFQWVLRVDFL